MKGRLFDLKRLAVHDGPGIRTTLFLKGCSLRCRWCHNPEGISREPEIGFRKSACMGCGACAEVCPNGAHVFVEGKHEFRREQCRLCGKCVDACPTEALEKYGRDWTVEEAARAVLEDKTFFDHSGGGCTLSGGEPLLQPEFCAAVLQRLREKNVHGAIDTSGAVSWTAFETVLPYADLFLYDVKHIDDRVHREQVGASNRLPLVNLDRLSRVGIPIEIRIPLIPGFNADESSLIALGERLSALSHLTGVRLLPFHSPRVKCAQFGRADAMRGIHPPTREEIAAAEEIMKRFGLRPV